MTSAQKGEKGLRNASNLQTNHIDRWQKEDVIDGSPLRRNFKIREPFEEMPMAMRMGAIAAIADIS